MDAAIILINAFLYILPAYIANSTAMLFGGGKALDFGRQHSDGRRIFGDGKTWRGLTAGVFFGSVAGYFEGAFLQGTSLALGDISFYCVLGIALSTGAVLGDLVASYGKRRAGLERGEAAVLIDQLDFVCGAAVLSLPIYLPNPEVFAVVLFATPAIHLFLNWASHKIRVKQVPW